MITQSIILNIAAGIVSGAATALLGYAKNKGENLEPEKIVQTLVIGAVVGGAAAYFNISYAQSETWLVSVGAITTIEYAKKAIIRRIFKRDTIWG